MKYHDLARVIAERTGLNVESVKDVISEFGETLMSMPENDYVLTPLGTFRIIRKASREIYLPRHKRAYQKKEELHLHYKPNVHCKKPIY